MRCRPGRWSVIAVLTALPLVACRDNPTVLPRSNPPPTISAITDSVTTAATTTTLSATAPSSTVTTTTRFLGPPATFRVAGKTLQVRPSDHRKAYANLGDQLPVPPDVQIEFGVPGIDGASGTVVPRADWDTGSAGEALEIDPGGEAGRFIWRATVPPGEYGLEITFTQGAALEVVRAPIKVG